MAIVERAFSYGGLLVRTFHHADAASSEPQPVAPEVSSPPWTSEQLPPPKRPRGGSKKKRKTSGPLSPIQLDLSALLTPGTTGPESDGLQDREAPVAPPQYISLLTPDELRAIQTRNRRGKLWIPPESTVLKELNRLGRGTNREAAAENMKKAMLTDGPVRYMQETGCITDVDRFMVEGALGVPGLKGTSTPALEVDDTSTALGYGGTDTWSGSPTQNRILDQEKDSGSQAAVVTGRASDSIHPSPTHGVTLPSPIPVSTTDGQQGLYLPPLLTQAANTEPPIPSPGPPAKLPLPGLATNKPRAVSLPEQSLFKSLPEASPENPRTRAMSSPYPITPAPPQPKRSRGRPRKNIQTTDSNLTPETFSVAPAPTFTPPASTQSPLTQKRKRPTPPPKSTTSPHKPPPLHLSSVADFLSHLTSTIETAASGFIPRPVSTSYTLPTPAFPTLAGASDKDYKSFAVGLVAKISEIDKLQWTIAHSQWTTSKSKFTAGARWVCNLSEEGVRDRGSKGGAPAGVGVMRAYTSPNETPTPKPRYPCGGSIAVRFSTSKDIITVRYTHHAVHAPPKDLREEAHMKRVKEHRKLIVSDAWGPAPRLPTPLSLPLPPPIVAARRVPLLVEETKAMKGVAIGESKAEGGGKWVWERRVE